MNTPHTPIEKEPKETNALWCYPEDHKKAKIKCIEKGMTQMEFIKYLLELDKKYETTNKGRRDR